MESSQSESSRDKALWKYACMSRAEWVIWSRSFFRTVALINGLRGVRRIARFVSSQCRRTQSGQSRIGCRRIGKPLSFSVRYGVSAFSLQKRMCLMISVGYHFEGCGGPANKQVTNACIPSILPYSTTTRYQVSLGIHKCRIIYIVN
jgi:hypothetical protein